MGKKRTSSALSGQSNSKRSRTKRSSTEKSSGQKRKHDQVESGSNVKPKNTRGARNRELRAIEKKALQVETKSLEDSRSNSYDALAPASKDSGDDDEVIDMASDESSSSNGGDVILLDSDAEPEEADAIEENQDFIALDFSSDDESDDSTESIDEVKVASKDNKSVTKSVNPEYPWFRNNDHTKQLEVSDWLTMEIKDFVKYISPSKEEIEARNNVVLRLNEAVADLWPDAELHCFGSYATDLYLPGSDIDTVIISENQKYDNKPALYQLSSYLRAHKLGKYIETISKAKVPIIKFVDPETGFHIDISFERDNGLSAAQIIISWINSTPGLRELVMVVKQFLAVRKLNEVHTGGLGGFSIICLVYSFLKLHPRILSGSINATDNLGVLLIEFFELYGFNFGYDDVAIAFENRMQPIYVSKRSNPGLLNFNSFSLAIQDPQDPDNNISRGTFNLRDIKRSFGGAFELLVNKCYDMNTATYKQRLGQSILGNIIKYKGKARDFADARSEVENHAFQIASGRASREDLLSSASVSRTPSVSAIPTLETTAAHKVVNVDYEYTSDSGGSDDEDLKLQKVFEKSQSASKNGAESSEKRLYDMMGIKKDDEGDDDEYEPNAIPATKDVVPLKNDRDADSGSSDSGSDYDPSQQVSSHQAAVDKTTRREYWLQKGASF
ncbi:DEKNAAC102640 [Brettanomyces naardenensis]|uniref:polynucleotide adenylyltransferase n=1 Tax=Brettanomyces naardenensis TaxID=13370 RepID=A0A448YKV2_BRENA|nr:DEKNAAC102640 [Brettanomyces naardenensis]